MGFGKRMVSLITVVMALLALFIMDIERSPEDALSVDVTVDNVTENIECWQVGSEYYLFLPGYGSLDQMRLRTGKWEVLLNGERLADGTSCETIDLNWQYSLQVDGEELGTLTILRSSGAGAMFLDVASGNMDYIHAKKGNEESGELRLYSREGELDYSGRIDNINGRGNSTWNMEKKSYSVTLVEDGDLLGMGSAKKWILLSNAMDTSGLRNKVVFDFAKEFGLAYAPDSDWVDLYLNGEYAGLYLLCERNEVHPERVAISESGSFLVSKDAEGRMEDFQRVFFKTDAHAALRVHYMDMELESLQDIWQSAENAILAEDGVDPVSGKSWQECIDVESWVKKYLVEEGFANIDGTNLSQYFYMDGSDGTGKIYAGPVWDYDLAILYDAEHMLDSVRMFFGNVPGNYGSPWPDALYHKPEYYAQIVAKYETEFTPLMEHYIQTTIPQYAQRILDAAEMNALRWGVPTESTELLQQYLTMRLDFLDSVWLEGKSYCTINAVDIYGSRSYYAVEAGDLPPSQLHYEAEDSGYEYRWYVSGTGERFDLNAPVYESVDIYVRYEPITPPVQQEASAQPEQTAETEQAEQAAEPEPKRPLIVWGEPISPLRLAPFVLFLLVLMAVMLAGAFQLGMDKKRKKK